MEKSIFTLLLLIMFVSTACDNDAINEGKQEGEKQNQVEEEPGKDAGLESETEGKEEDKASQTKENAKDIVKEKAEKVLKLLGDKNAEELSTYVHPEKGVLFSPYVYVDTDAITFDKETIRGFFENNETYIWGTHDGSGEPIELTPSDYYPKFIYDGKFQEADEIVLDRVDARGNTKRNINEVFPDAHTVEYFVEGTEENGNMDWKALNLVFEQDKQGEWKLVAIVHDQWTI